jgi:hypothetical protein
MVNAVIVCKFNQTARHPPKRLVLSSSRCGPPDAILSIEDTTNRRLEVNFTVCLHQPFWDGYNSTEEFLQWVEVNRIFGAQRFLVYNFTGDSNLHPYIKYYTEKKLMEVHDWQIELFLHQIPYVMAQCALINDCIYRSMFKSKYLLLQDVDELMVPQRAENWVQAMGELLNCKDKAELMTTNIFFPRNSKKNNVESRYEFLDFIHRINGTKPCPDRTKLIVEPDKVLRAGTHYVMESIRDEIKPCCVSEEDILMQHYRVVSSDILSPDSVENVLPHPRMKHFEKPLISAIENTRREIDKIVRRGFP